MVQLTAPTAIDLWIQQPDVGNVWATQYNMKMLRPLSNCVTREVGSTFLFSFFLLKWPLLTVQRERGGGGGGAEQKVTSRKPNLQPLQEDWSFCARLL